MRQRPVSVTVVGWLFIVAGGVGLTYHLAMLRAGQSFDLEHGAVLVLRLLAVVGGVGLLYGSKAARWLLVAWMAYHIVLSALHTLGELLMHVAIFGVILYALFHPRTSAYLRGNDNPPPG